MKHIILVGACMALVSAPGSFAQEQKPDTTVRKLVKIEHENAEEIGKLLQWIRYYPSRSLGSIILQGTPEEVAKAEEIIRAVDQPHIQQPRYEGAVELDAYFLSAGAELVGQAVPTLVEAAVAELRSRFPYAEYGLLDSTLLRISVGSGEAQVRGEFASESSGPVSYRLSVTPSQVLREKGARSIYLDNLNAQWSIPYREEVTNFETGQISMQKMTRDVSIQTDVSVPEGKLVVVGKAGSPTDAQAIFLVLRARLVD
jgi:hypothetical protein